MADTTTKPIPKSLHTVTVFTKLVEHFSYVDQQPFEDAMDRLLNVLGYSDDNDPHGLAASALKALDKKKEAGEIETRDPDDDSFDIHHPSCPALKGLDCQCELDGMNLVTTEDAVNEKMRALADVFDRPDDEGRAKQIESAQNAMTTAARILRGMKE